MQSSTTWEVALQAVVCKCGNETQRDQILELIRGGAGINKVIWRQSLYSEYLVVNFQTYIMNLPNVSYTMLFQKKKEIRLLLNNGKVVVMIVIQFNLGEWEYFTEDLQ